MGYYLEEELYSLIKTDEMFLFLEYVSNDGLWYWDLYNTDEEYYSDNFWSNLGYDPKTKKYKSYEWQSIIFPEDLEKATNLFRECITDKNKEYDLIVRYKNFNNGTNWIRCRGIIIYDKNKNPKRMLGIHTDFTKIKELEYNNEELLKSTKNQEIELIKNKRFEKDVEYTIARIAHEIKNPCNTISGNLELTIMELEDIIKSIKEGTTSKIILPFVEESLSNLQDAKSSTEHMLTMLADLIDSIKITTGNVRLEEETFDLNYILEEVKKLTHIIAKQKGLNIYYKLEKNINNLSGTPKRIIQIVINLINNAIKFTKTGINNYVNCKITSELLTKNRYKIFFIIEDTGCGFDKKTSDEITEKFRKKQDILEIGKVSQGNGLGLILSQRLAIMMGGDIIFSSVENQGSTFVFSIILEKTDEIINIDKNNVLVIDDNDLNLKLMDKMLNKIGIPKICFNNGYDAIEYCKKQKVNLVLIDMHMPGINGIETAKEINNIDNKINIVFITGNVNEDQNTQALNNGAKEIIYKPVDLKTLNMLFAKYLEPI